MGAKRCCVLCGGVGRVVAVAHRDGMGIVVEEAFFQGLEDLAGCALTDGTLRGGVAAPVRGRPGLPGQEM